MSTTYRIHPAIGIARLGDSPTEYFLGSEAPGIPPYLGKPDAPLDKDAKHRDAQQRIKRQGARFRIYEYAPDAAGTPRAVRELTAADADIRWEVRLANRKAASPQFNGNDRRNASVPEEKLIIDSGPQVITGVSQSMTRLHGAFMGLAVPLGDLLSDIAGRLIVLGGLGHSESVPPDQPLASYSNNDGWHDDISDGPVRATVSLHGSSESVEADSSWLLVAPPDFAPEIVNIITLYDIVYNQMARFDPALAVTDASRVSFTRDVHPILSRVSNMHWVSDNASRHRPGQRGHFLARLAELCISAPESAAARQHILDRLRNPFSPGTSKMANMPKLPSAVVDESVVGATLTHTQYQRMVQWAKGEFDNDWTGREPPAVPFDQIPIADQPAALDRRPLESSVGAGRFPGIEVGNIMLEPETYDPARPFRINTALPPGSLTARMAVPWQADFRDCEFEEGGYDWWPGQRPNEVWRFVGGELKREPWRPQTDEWVVNADADILAGRHTMVARWSGLGFVLKRDIDGETHFVEDERAL
jgi:hypothetical protein